MRHLSFSQLGTLLGCPEKHRRQYLLGERGPASAAIIMGQSAHRLPEVCLRDVQEGRSMRQKATALNEVAKTWDTLATDHIDWSEGAGQLDPGECLTSAMRMAEVFYDEALPGVRKGSLHAEWSFAIPIPGVQGWTFNGSIDHIRRVGKTLFVDDWKTSSKKWSQSRADTSMQVQAYYWAIWQHFGELPGGFSFHVVTRPRKGNPSEYDRLETGRARGLVEAFTGRLAYAVKVIGLHDRSVPSDKRDEYEYHRWCPYRKDCTPWEGGEVGARVIL
jgi:hypothetical protein